MKDLLRIADLSRAGLARLLNLAAAAKHNPLAWDTVLAGSTVVCYFEKPPARAHLSFGTATTRLGGIPQVARPGELPVGPGETIEDTARVVSRYAAAFVVGTSDDDDLHRVAAAASIPVVNASSDRHHPCQALADLLTMQQRFGSLPGRRVAYLGAAGGVAHSLLEACALAGIDITVATPPAYEPDDEVVATAKRIACASSARVVTTHDPRQAVEGADAVYTDVWVASGTPPDERAARTAALTPYRVDEAAMAAARPGALFLHCLPAHRGDEVAAPVIDGPQSAVFDQAENRLHTSIAVLVGLTNGSVVGASEDRGRLVRGMR